MPGLRILPLAQGDLPEVADVHVRVWQDTYRGQMPQDFLDGLRAEDRLAGWRQGFSERRHDPRYGTLVARAGGALAGFASYGPARDEGRAEPMELYAFNILAAHQGKGIGFRLFRECCKALRAQECGQTYLWVLDTNLQAIDAYRRWGGTAHPGVVKSLAIGGRPLTEIAVTFPVPR